MSEIRVVSGELAFMPHVETNHLLLLLIIVLYPKMITVYRIREMVSFELGEEIEKDVFRLVISVGQRENFFSISLLISKLAMSLILFTK